MMRENKKTINKKEHKKENCTHFECILNEIIKKNKKRSK